MWQLTNVKTDISLNSQVHILYKTWFIQDIYWRCSSKLLQNSHTMPRRDYDGNVYTLLTQHSTDVSGWFYKLVALAPHWATSSLSMPKHHIMRHTEGLKVNTLWILNLNITRSKWSASCSSHLVSAQSFASTTTASLDVVAKMSVLPLPKTAHLSYSPMSQTPALKYLREQIMHFCEFPALSYSKKNHFHLNA